MWSPLACVLVHGCVAKLLALVPEPCATENPQTSTCFSSELSYEDQLHCLLEAPSIPHLEQGCGVNATESFTPTHFCLGSNGTTAGWGFRVPVGASIVPRNIFDLTLEGLAYATTSPSDIFQDSDFEMVVGVAADTDEDYNKTMIRRCAIEDAVGPVGVLHTIEHNPDAGERNVTMNLSNPGALWPDTTIVGNKLMLMLAGNATAFSNNGPIPPAIANTTLTIIHRMRIDI